jgi:hypothetical protein
VLLDRCCIAASGLGCALAAAGVAGLIVPDMPPPGAAARGGDAAASRRAAGGADDAAAQVREIAARARSSSAIDSVTGDGSGALLRS